MIRHWGSRALEPQSGQRFHADAATRPSLARTRALQPQLRSGVPAALFAGSDLAPAHELLPRQRDRPAGQRRPRRRRRDRRRSRASIPRPLVRAGRHPGRPGRGRGPQSRGTPALQSRRGGGSTPAAGAHQPVRRCSRTPGQSGDRRATAGWLRSGNRVPRSRSCPGPGCGPT